MELEIFINNDGSVKAHIKDKGGACLKLAEVLRKAVGPETDRKLRPEYYEPETHVRSDLDQRR